ncbi:MAG: hypothetical protein LBH32_05440 [Dysgonamonadaceae bacterium]|jgi:hypothetical protein|nr:hypothetical protein [Dysgonamonadaceae bacterium]
MKSNKKINQVVSGVLSASILTTSCTQYVCPDTERIYGNVLIDSAD